MRARSADLTGCSQPPLSDLQQRAETAHRIDDAAAAQGIPRGRLVAGDDRPAEVLLQQSDDFEHANLRAAYEVGVGVRVPVRVDELAPGFRRHLVEGPGAGEFETFP